MPSCPNSSRLRELQQNSSHWRMLLEVGSGGRCAAGLQAVGGVSAVVFTRLIGCRPDGMVAGVVEHAARVELLPSCRDPRARRGASYRRLLPHRCYRDGRRVLFAVAPISLCVASVDG